MEFFLLMVLPLLIVAAAVAVLFIWGAHKGPDARAVREGGDPACPSSEKRLKRLS